MDCSCGSVAQGVECLPTRKEAMSSNPQYCKINKQTKAPVPYKLPSLWYPVIATQNGLISLKATLSLSRKIGLSIMDQKDSRIGEEFIGHQEYSVPQVSAMSPWVPSRRRPVASTPFSSRPNPKPPTVCLCKAVAALFLTASAASSWLLLFPAS
jgi:hypothetical protein